MAARAQVYYFYVTFDLLRCQVVNIVKALDVIAILPTNSIQLL
jgi:hypothetical protein